MKKLIPLIVLLATAPVLTLTSCDLLLEILVFLLEPGDSAFYAKDLTTNKDYRVTSELVYGNEDHPSKYCKIYQEKGAKGSLSQTDINKLGKEYDEVIHQLLVDKFSMKSLSYTDTDTNRKYDFNNMLEFANWAVGGTDGKLTILLLDIKDGWAPGKGYVAGYFWAGNFLNMTGSNGKDMIYIDTYPALTPSVRRDPPPIDELLEDAYSTLAHEGQHLVNFITSLYLLIDGGKEEDRVLMDTWIDEGLASQAEYFFQVTANINVQENNNNVSRCIGFNEDSEGTIAKGNNFFVWGNYSGNSVLDEYSTVYLFNRWLYLQANAGSLNNPDFFMKIISSQYGDQRAVTEVAKTINNTWSEWPTLLGTWMAANYYPANETFGYKGDNWLRNGTLKNNTTDPNFKGIKARAISGSTAQLAPGEGVYSKKSSTSAFNPSTTSTNIRYAGVSNSSTTVTVQNSGSITSGDIVITFNANTDAEGSKETGSLTSGDADPKASIVQGRSVGRSIDPYRIDARDLMGRNRDKALLKTGLFKEFKANIGTVPVEVQLDDQEQ